MKMSIVKQVVIGFLISPLLLGCIGGMSYYFLQKVNESYSNLVNHQARAAFDSHVIQFDSIQQMNFLNAYFVVNESQYLEGFKRTNIDLNELAVKVAPNLSGDGQVSLTQIKELNAKLQAQADKVAGLLKSDPQEAQRIIRQEVLPAGSEINNLSKTIVDQQEQLMKEAYDNNSILVDSIRNMILLASVLAIIIALTFGLILGSKISRPLSIVNRQLKNIAQGEGDLTRQIVIQSKGEFGEIAAYFNLMVQNLRKLIQQIGSHAEQFTFKATQLKQSAVDSGIASERITKTVQGLAVGSERQHNKVDESSRIIDLISDRARQVAINMEHASSAVDRTKKAAFQGNEAINSAMIKMSSVHDSLGIVNGIVQQLDERSKEIEKSIHLITDIARRTNLIALNAGIESARVGEHGKGFTVVANEVRTLAVQSSAAAETIVELIVGIREETQQAARFMLENAREASEGLQVVNIAGSFFDHIVQSIQDIHQEFGEVSVASSRMAADTEHIATAIHSIAEVAVENMEGTSRILLSTEEQQAAVESISLSIQELSIMAEELQASIGRFKV